MKSIQTKIIIVITVIMLIATGTLMLTAMIRSRRVLDTDSDKIIQTSADYYAEKLNNSNGSYEDLVKLVAGIDVYGNGSMFLMTKEGDIVYHTKYKNGISFDELPSDEQEHFANILGFEKDRAIWHDCIDNVHAKIVIKELDNGLLFGITVPQREIAIPQIRLVIQLFFTSVIIVVVSIFVGLFWVMSIVKPLKKMTEVADHYAKGDYSEKMAIDSKDEVGRLSRSLEAMAESLVKQIEIADEANKAKSNFLSHMSHEIRTPITAVMGLNEMILREADDQEILKYSENIKTSGNTLLGLINDILDFSKIEAGKIEIVPVDYDLSSVINDLVNMVRIRTDEKGLSLVVDFDKDTPRLLYGDEVRIKQVITNLLTNAVKYTEKGSVTFSIGYEKDEGDKDSVLLKVSVNDTGIGIREEDMGRLFAEFERIDEKRNRNIEGTGLGMSITRSLLGMMGSNLIVESKYGKGSKFSFVLKQKVVKWEPLGNYKESYYAASGRTEKYRSSFTAPSAHILMVDDNATNLLVFKSLLKETYVMVDTASSGDECLELCADTKYDIIFLDHMMPGKDGIETLHELKGMKDSANRDTVVICLTANAISGAREEYIKEGFDDYITKPIEPDKLEKIMMMYLPKEKIDDSSKGMILEFDPVKTDDTADRFGKNFAEIAKSGNLSVLDDQDVIAKKTGLKYCGSEQVYLEVLASFREDAEGSIEKLRKYLKDNDPKNYEIKVHSIKSNSKAIGATELSELARELEDAAKNGDMDRIRDKHEELIHQYMRVREVLEKVFGRQLRI